MIYRKPTVIQIKAEEDIQDVQSIKSSTLMTPNNNFKGRHDSNSSQMDVPGFSGGQRQSPYASELFNSYLRN